MDKLLVLLCCLFLFYNSSCIDVAYAKSDELYNRTELAFLYDAINDKPTKAYFQYNVSDWKDIFNKHPFDFQGIPSLGWKTGETMEALYRAYEITGDHTFSDILISLTDDIIKKRDDRLNIVAWDGRVYSMWSCGSRYHGAYFDIRDKQGNLGSSQK